MSYGDLIDRREAALLAKGRGIEPTDMAEHLFGFQAYATTWALRRGRAAIFGATGTGKTIVEMEWARQVGGTVLLLAPLAVGEQIARMAAEFDAGPARVVSDGSELAPGLNIANYERLHRFTPDALTGLVLDESSILKAFDGKTRRELTEFGLEVPLRLAATATPAPNDYEELGQHAEFLGVLTAREMLALYFTQDGNTTTKWRIKGHARQAFWRWVSSWGLAFTGPADLGFPEEQARFVLPPLRTVPIVVAAKDPHVTGTLFAGEAQTLQERREARRNTLTERVEAAAALVAAEPDEQWLLWCDLNAESEALTKAIPGAVEVRGSDTREHKIAAINWFIGEECLCGAKKSRSDAASTCASGPNAIGNTSGSIGASQLTSAMRDAESCTRPIPSDERELSPTPNDGKSRTLGSTSQAASSRSESPPTSTTPCLPRRTGVAQSVDAPSRSMTRSAAVTDDAASTSITITTPGTSGESSAHRAISASASSEMTPDDLREPPCTCGWESGRRTLVSKPSIFGHGLNLQTCARMAFVGLSDSFERYHQAVRRCHRFGQKREVVVYVVTADAEGAVVRNIERKERQMTEMMAELVANVGRTGEHVAARSGRDHDDAEGDGWRYMLGDCVERISGQILTGPNAGQPIPGRVEDESVGLCVFSPPFPSMYVYTDDPRDMGNVADVEAMIEQFSYLVPELLRVLMPGRSCAIHLAQAQTRKRDGGEVGLRDFRGATIDAMVRGGFTFYGEATIDKSPQVKAVRTKDRGLLFKSLANDSSMMRMAQADYLLQFRKPGENPRPIRAGISAKYGNPDGWITADEWIEWAAPVWHRARPGVVGGIRETDTLNVAIAKDSDDGRHLCPLQRGVIERCVKLWTAPGDLVLSPFGGVASEGAEALRLGRRSVAVELKRSYFETGCRNLAAAVAEREQGVFDLTGS